MLQTVREYSTAGRGTYEITGDVTAVVRDSPVRTGLCHLFLQHTSASLIVCENADPSVRRDLERFAARWIVDGDPLYEHDAEGPDDMPAHLRSIFTQTSLTVPVTDGRPALGTWQGIFLWEHRRHGDVRKVTITVTGE